MASLIDTIKAKIDVVDEVSLVVALRKSGKSLQGLCPFHNERTPSFHVFPESQTWRCFGCQEGGDVFTFVEKQQGVDFPEALRYLAEKAGVSLEAYSSPNPEQEREANALKERLRKLNEDAVLWFHQMLLRSKEAAEARAYLQSRGVSSESVIAFSLGYAPDHWDALSRYLLGQGYTEQELVNGGLARAREMAKVGSSVRVSGEEQVSGVYDYFRGRIIFPIRDIRGRVIGFGGRALGDGQPKYLNSPQTLLFEKNSVLYALDMARDAIKLAKQVVIVEGYVDAVIAHQYGTKQTVACIGSAITEKHIQQIKKLTKQVTLALDPDAAGVAATEHGIQEALKAFDRTVVPVPVVANSRSAASKGYQRNEPRGMIRLEEAVDAEINVVQLPAGEDPDEVIRRDFAAWTGAVAHPLPLIDYYFVARTADLNLREPAAKAEAAKRLLPVIGSISDRVKRDAYLRKLATMINIEERSLNDELQHLLRGQKSNGVIAAFSDRGWRQHSARGVTLPGEMSPGREQSGAGEESARMNGPEEAKEESGRISQPKDQRRQESRTFGLDKRIKDRIKWEDYLIGLLLQNPGLWSHVCGIINDGDFAGTDTRELYHIFNSVYQRDSSPLFQSFEEFVPSALLETVARARESVESGSPLDGAGLVKEAVQCANRLKRACLLQSNTELQHLERGAAEAGDSAAVRQYRRQKLEIYRQLRTIDSATHLQG